MNRTSPKPDNDSRPEPDMTPGSPRQRNRQTEPANKPVEIGGPRGLEPTRYNDWEKKGRCIDF